MNLTTAAPGSGCQQLSRDAVGGDDRNASMVHDASDRGACFFAAFVIGYLMLKLPEAGARRILGVDSPLVETDSVLYASQYWADDRFRYPATLTLLAASSSLPPTMPAT